MTKAANWGYIAPEIIWAVHTDVRAQDEPAPPAAAATSSTPPADGGGGTESPPAQGTAAAAQDQLAKSDTKPSLLSDKPEDKPAEPTAFDPTKLTWGEDPTAKPDEKLLGSFGEVATKHGLSQEAAQALINLHLDFVKQHAEKAVTLWNETREKWVNEARADAEVGGDKLQGVIQTVAKVLNDPTLADPGIKKALDETGAGDHPAVIRTLYRMAKALTEGRHVAGDPPGAKPEPKTAAQRLYPNNP